MNIATETLMSINSLRTLLDSATAMLSDFENRLHYAATSLDLEEQANAAMVVAAVEALRAEMIDDIGSLFALNKTVNVVAYPPEDYPHLVTGTIIINNTPYIPCNETFVRHNDVTVALIQDNLLIKLD